MKNLGLVAVVLIFFFATGELSAQDSTKTSKNGSHRHGHFQGKNSNKSHLNHHKGSLSPSHRKGDNNREARKSNTHHEHRNGKGNR